MEKPKRPRVELTVSQKKEICRYYQEHPNTTMNQLKDHFSHCFGLRIGRSTVGTIVSRAEHWNSIDFGDNVRRTPSTKFANMEKALFEWICKEVEGVTDEQILEKAADLIQEDGNLAKEWNKSRGWITSFKRRFNLVVLRSAEDVQWYRPGKLPEDQEPLRRVQSRRGRVSAQYSPPQGPMHVPDTSSIIYDAAVENILQDPIDDSDMGDSEQYCGDTPNRVSAPSKSIQDSTIRTRNSSARTSNVDASIIQDAAIQNILHSETVSTLHESQNTSQVVTTTSTEVIPVTLIQGSVSTSPTPVSLSSAKSAMKTLLTYFEQNPNTSIADHNHLHALDARLKWLAAKEAVGELKTYLSNDVENQRDVKYLNDLDKRLDEKSSN